MKRAFLFTVLALLIPAASTAQYTPSKGQFAKLARQKARLVKIQVEIARLQTEIVFEVGNLDRICREVVLANHWPANVECNPQNLLFAVPPPPPATATLPQVQPPAAASPEQKKP